jgi:hypothetical protein
MVTPLGREMLIIAGKSANKSVSTSTLAYDNRVMEKLTLRFQEELIKVESEV